MLNRTRREVAWDTKYLTFLLVMKRHRAVTYDALVLTDFHPVVLWGLMESQFGLALLVQIQKRGLCHSSSLWCSNTWAFWVIPWPSFKYPVFRLFISLVFYISVGVLRFLLALCMALWLSLLLSKTGLLHLWYTIYAESCHPGTEVFNEMGQDSGVSNIMDCS